METELKITESAQELRKQVLDEVERSEKTGEYFKPVYVDVGALWDFENKYKPKEIVSGTNDGFVFEYKGKLFGAVSTDRIHKNQKGEDRFIYKLEKISGYADSPYFYLGLAWVNNERRSVKDHVDKYDKRFHIYPTFEENLEKKKLVKV